MDLTTFIEPKINLERIAEILDGLGHEGRYHTIRTWSKHHQAAIFEAAKGFKKLDLDFAVPSSVGNLVEVRHWGFNSLPMFNRFTKCFARVEGEETPIVGYNDQKMAMFTGPGYYMVSQGEGEHEGELIIDYTKVPKKQKPESWPEIRPSEGIIGSIVSGGQIDYLRGISTHVSIGTAYQHGKHRKEYFAMVRQDAS